MAAPYEILCAVKADANIPVTKYRSKKTGITVVIAEVEGPLVNGYFALGAMKKTHIREYWTYWLTGVWLQGQMPGPIQIILVTR
ncbi:hypothetical protein MAR_032937 [Mya arenaria]|uniref:Uncharacterized protein n=1 Tax=Mya arenaria TaxID=6604 RepID=A0ABY7G7J6_MYAAR|nr:hypothetical protein MAR_032937 [Mya arenaria]